MVNQEDEPTSAPRKTLCSHTDRIRSPTIPTVQGKDAQFSTHNVPDISQSITGSAAASLQETGGHGRRQALNMDSDSGSSLAARGRSPPALLPWGTSDPAASAEKVTQDGDMVFDPPHVVTSSYVSPGVHQVAHNLTVSPFLVYQCIEKFFSRLQPVMPVLKQSVLTRRFTQSLDDSDECVVVALCALALLRSPGAFEQGFAHRQHLAQHMIQRCQQLRQGFAWLSTTPSHSAIVSYFLSLCCFDLQQSAAQRHYLREAIDLAEKSGSDNSVVQGAEVAADEASMRVLSDLLYVTEVSSSIQRHHASHFRTVRDEPFSAAHGVNEVIVHGVHRLFRVFQLLDQGILQCPGHAHTTSGTANCRQLLIRAHNGLGVLDRVYAHFSQQADILITIEWARLMLWNASVSHGFVSRSDDDPAFRYDFPAVIAKSLCEVIRDLPLEAIYDHGLGIVGVKVHSV
jgi:hypothetical protein